MAARPSNRVDFRSLGAEAYPGHLAVASNALLVEPISIRDARRRATPRLTTLGHLAPAKSGIPTRAVNYFCVEEEIDEQVLVDHGLTTRRDRDTRTVIVDGRGTSHVMERSSLRKLLRRPDLAEGRISITDDNIGRWRLFYVRFSRDQLQAQRRRDTLSYIDYGATTNFQASIGSRRQGGVISQRAQVQARGSSWWSLPLIDERAGRIAWVKGRGERHYVSALPEGVLIPDNFLFSVPPTELGDPMLLAAMANMSWTHLMAEIFGRRAGGDGVLHTYIRDLNRLPILDLRLLTPTEKEGLLEAFQPLTMREVLSVSDELREEDRQRFDRVALRLLFDAKDIADEHRAVERALRDLTAERAARAASGREQERRAERRVAFDPEPFAARLLADVGEPPRLLERISLDPGALGSVEIEIPTHAQAESVDRTQQLFSATEVRVNGDHLLDAPSEAHAEAIVAALRREPDLVGAIQLPVDTVEMSALVDQWRSDFDDWRTRLDEALRRMVRHPQRRVLVRAAVARQAACAPDLI